MRYRQLLPPAKPYRRQDETSSLPQRAEAQGYRREKTAVWSFCRSPSVTTSSVLPFLPPMCLLFVLLSAVLSATSRQHPQTVHHPDILFPPSLCILLPLPSAHKKPFLSADGQVSGYQSPVLLFALRRDTARPISLSEDNTVPIPAPIIRLP